MTGSQAAGYVLRGLCLALAAFPGGGALAQEHGGPRGESADLYAIPEQSQGHAQSPIDILSDATSQGHHVLRFGGERHPRAKTVAYTGHTVRIEFEGVDLLRFDDRTYALGQCHFHTPSEHRIDGVTYPMEMHCVAESPPRAGEAGPGYLVLGYLFRMGKSNPMVAALIAGHPHRGETRALGDDTPLDAADILTGLTIAGHFYSYRGSLTTPPFSETVRWVIDKEIRQASPEEIVLLNALEGNNARHIQAPNGRKVDSE